MIARVAKMYDSLMLENSLIQKNIKSLPSPEQAAKTALSQLEEFIKNDEFGIYRGEAFLSLADYYLEQRLNANMAEQYLDNARKWFNNFAKVKQKNAKYAVPDKAELVTQPPYSIYKTDAFQNINPVKIKPESVINRLTSRPYLDGLITKYYRMRAFIFFVNKNFDKAVDFFNKMREYDRLSSVYEANGDWGDCSRLIWGAKHHYFYAKEDELASFGDKLRLPVLLADYYYTIMKFEKSANIHRKILSGRIKGAPRILKAYSTFMLGHYFYWKNDRGKTISLWKKSSAMAKNSYTGERSLYGAAKLAVSKIDNISPFAAREYQKDGEKMLRQLSQNAQFRDFKIGAKTSLALYLYKKNRKPEALDVINSFSPKTDFENKLQITYIDIINDKYK